MNVLKKSFNFITVIFTCLILLSSSYSIWIIDEDGKRRWERDGGGRGGSGGTTTTPEDQSYNECNQIIDPNKDDNSLTSFLRLSVVSPFGDILTSSTKRFKTCRGCESPDTTINIVYQGFSKAFSCGLDKKIYCTVGGLYQIQTELKIVGVPSHLCEGGCSKTLPNRDLYYCPTTIDLYKSVKIPQSWENAKLLVYCNDGVNSGHSQFKDLNFEFFSKIVKSYKVCIVKNEDLDEKNTIVYGLEYGLPDVRTTKVKRTPNVRAKPTTVFDTTTMEEGLVQGLNLKEILPVVGDLHKAVYTDVLDTEYTLEYNSNNYEFVIYENGLDLDGVLTNFDDLSNIDESENTKSIFIRKKVDNEKILGYDAAGIEKGINTRLPIYYINNFNFNQTDSCITYLGKYGAITPTSSMMSLTDKVRCMDSGIIEINSKEISNPNAFNIYKNIVFNYR